MTGLQYYAIIHVAAGLPLCVYVYRQPPRTGGFFGWALCFLFWPLLTAYAVVRGSYRVFKERYENRRLDRWIKENVKP